MTGQNGVVRGWISIIAVLGMVAMLAVAPAPGEAEEQTRTDAASAEPGTSPRTPTVTIAEELEETLLTAAGEPADAATTAIITAHDTAGVDEVESAGITGERLGALPMIIVEDLTGAQLDLLSAMPAVRSVWGVEEYELHMQESAWTTGARDVWEDHGYTGAGVELAVVDTGADGLHHDFANLIEFCNASLTGTGGLVLCTEATETAVDDNGHGTHVAGTMAGTGEASGGIDDPHSTIGMAPEASIRSYAANVAASLLNTDIIAAYDDLIERKLAGEIDVVAINNSFGGGIGSNYDPDAPQAIAYKAANEAGMLPVFSAGNSGPEDNTLGVQCLSPYVLCVGASTKSGGITAFSSVGRPAAPHPGQADEDLTYDNHDRRLARAFGLGVYRPGIVAPGAVINAMMANAPGCRVGMPSPTGCYEELQGTSMSAPHVTGAAALVVEAFREAHDRTPSADEIMDILERSASPLPGHPAEQQGAGELDVKAAVELALVYDGDGTTEPDWTPVGTPHPLYADDAHPGGDTLLVEQLGCTGTGSFTVKEEAAVTTFSVPEGAGDLTVDVEWGDYHPDANLYLELFRPGHDPAASEDDPGPTRTFPVAESAGLVHTDGIIDDVGPPATSRSVSFAQPEPGEWALRVAHRVGGTVQPCGDHDNTDETQRAEGFRYDVEVHATRITDQPETDFSADRVDADTVRLDGTATYPDPLEGVTTWQAPGSRTDAVGGADAEIAETLYFDGTPADALEQEGDIVSDEPSGEPPVTQTAETSLANDDMPWNPLAITWTGEFSGDISGNLVFDWWWGSPNVTGLLLGVEAHVTVFADPVEGEGEQPERVVARQEVRFDVGPDPVQNENTVFVSGTFDETIQIQVSPVFVDTGPGLTAYYGADSTLSQFGIPEPAEMAADADAPDNVRVTDLQDSLRIAWDPVDDADDGYEVHRSTDPAFTVSDATRIATTEGEECVSPRNPTWTDVDRDGLCLTDDDVEPDTTYYYRVVTLDGTERGDASLLAYGTPTFPDRQALARVDRLFGPGYWEDAETDGHVATSWTHLWDQRGLHDPADPGARVFSQGVGSAVTETSPPVFVSRVPGSNRAETACMLAEATYGQGGFDTVLIARWDDYPDSLAGNYLAGQLDVPVLFTHTGHVTSATQACLDANEPDSIILLGGPVAISTDVEDDLEGQGYEVDRVGGADRYATAAMIATCEDEDRGWSEDCAVGEHDDTSGPTGIVASGMNFPDALVSSAVGYDQEFPLLLTRTDRLPDATRDAINELGLTFLLLPGGPSAVSEDVEAEIIATTTVTEIHRFDGERRTDTAVMVADWAVENYGWGTGHVNLARSDPPDGFADALVTGPHAGQERNPILLVWAPQRLDVTDAAGDDRRHTETWLRDHACELSSVHLAGGFAAISLEVEQRVRVAADDCDDT